jgi:hypothetical protein
MLDLSEEPIEENIHTSVEFSTMKPLKWVSKQNSALRAVKKTAI